LNLSLNPFSIGETAFAFGYAEMEDIPLAHRDNQMSLGKRPSKLYVSTGRVAENCPRNQIDHNVMVPGPCFDFRAKIPGKMSGVQFSVQTEQ